MTLLTRGVRWCPVCVARAMGRGTVVSGYDDDGSIRLALVTGARVEGVLRACAGGRCSSCEALAPCVFEVRPTRERPRSRRLRRAH